MRYVPPRLRFLWQNLKDRVQRLDQTVSSWKTPYRVLLAVLIALPVIGLYGHLVNAQSTAVSMPLVIGGAPGAMVLLILSGMIYISAALIFIINMALMYLVIFVAGYNDFVSASPVATGWPLVRDVANMFFIVVLLVIAFGTIVGYHEVDYRKYLPKLLLMAVLINFSKLLVGLLIDFSQVIMLTFVNGFKDAAFGNFVTLFGLDKIFDLGKQLDGDLSGAAATIVNIFMSLIFSMIMLSIMATLLLIMLIYLVARIVGLWIVLIFSPMAFFVWAIPPKIGKGLAAFGSQWWKMLGALLVGGPIMAFFLWLTLAIVANNQDPLGKMSSANSAEMQSALAFIGGALDLGQLGRFIIGVTLLFFGVKTAISISGEVSSTLAKKMEGISKAGGPIGYPLRLAGRGAARVAKTGAKYAGKGAAYGAGILDQKLGVSKTLGNEMLSMGSKMGQKGGVQGLLGSVVASGGVKALGVSGARQAEADKRIGGEMKGLNTEQSQQFFRAKVGSFNPMTAQATDKAMGKKVLEKGYGMKRTEELKAEFLKSGMPKNQVDAAAKEALERERGEWIQSMKTNYGSDVDLQKELADNLKENPSRQGVKDAVRMAGKSTIKDVSEDALEDNAVLAGVLKNMGHMRDDGSVDEDGVAGDKRLKNLSARQRKSIDSFVGNSKTLQGKQDNQHLLKMLDNTANAADVAAAEKARKRFAVSSDLSSVNMVSYDAGTDKYSVSGYSDTAAVKEMLRNDLGYKGSDGNAEVLARSIGSINPKSNQGQALKNAFAQGVYDDPATADVKHAGYMQQVHSAGMPTAMAFGINDDGSYQSSGFKDAHKKVVGDAVVDLGDDGKSRQALQTVLDTDVSVVIKGGEAAQNVMSSIKGSVDSFVIRAQENEDLLPDAEKMAQAIGEKIKAAEKKQRSGVSLTGSDTAALDLKVEINSDPVARKMFLGR